MAISENTRVNRDGLMIHRYPTDVGSDEYPNYIMFNILKRHGDIGNKDDIAEGPLQENAQVDISNQSRPDNSPALGATFGVLAAGIGNAVASGKAVTATGKAWRDLIPGRSRAAKAAADMAGKLTAIVVGGAVGAATAIPAAIVFSDRDKVLLKTTIALHLNNKPSVSYKAQWADTELGILGGAAETLNKAMNEAGGGNLLGAAGKLLAGTGGAAAAAGLKNSAETPLKAVGDFRSFTEANTGQAINPFKAQLFKNMEFRTFSFDYVFLPRNKVEYESVQTIIKTFKQYMHPRFGQENYFMGYPAEFNIAYFHKEGANYENIFKLSSCALTDLKVEYGGADFVTFKEKAGAPTEIAMSLSFLELELLTEERVMDGY